METLTALGVPAELDEEFALKRWDQNEFVAKMEQAGVDMSRFKTRQGHCPCHNLCPCHETE